MDRTIAAVSLAALSACATAALPPPASDPPAESRDPSAHFFGDVTMAAGNYRHDTSGDGGTATGDTTGAYGGMRFDYVSDAQIGGGIALEGYGSDDDLFSGSDAKGRAGDF